MVLVSCQKEADSVSVDKASWKVAYTGGEYTIAVTANGEFTAAADQSWVTTTVGEGKVDFVAAENEGTEARTATITVTCGEATATAVVEQAGAPNYVSLGKAANSFIVSAAGYYYFDGTVMGNGDAGLHSSFPITSTKLDPKGAKLVWQEVDGLISNVELKDGNVRFEVASKDGNAVIAVTDASDNVLWSWHIWSAEEPNDVTVGNWVAMDRNLGATATSGTEAKGLYYQWGRKDPFSMTIAFDSGAGEGWYHPVVGGGEDASNAEIHSIAYSIAHPESFIAATDNAVKDWIAEPGTQNWRWGLNFAVDGMLDFQLLKTIFDPCPYGYAVASDAFYRAGWETKEIGTDATTLFDGKLTFVNSTFVYNGGYGWWEDSNKAACMWSCSTAWGNTSNAFRLSAVEGDPSGNYDPACAHAVRCVKFGE